MENSKTRKTCSGNAVQATRLDRVTARLEHLKQQLSQTRARQHEEKARMARQELLRQRQRNEQEHWQLGQWCRLAGLASIRESAVAEGEATESPLDAELITGALHLLAQQVKECSEQDLAQLRVSGRAILGKKDSPKVHEGGGDEV